MAGPFSITPRVGFLQAAPSGAYPTFDGERLPDSDWVKNLPEVYADFRRSNNIEDRRGDSFLKNWTGALLAGMANQLPSAEVLKASFNHPLMPVWQSMALSPLPPENELSRAAGSSDIAPFGMVPK